MSRIWSKGFNNLPKKIYMIQNVNSPMETRSSAQKNP